MRKKSSNAWKNGCSYIMLLDLDSQKEHCTLLVHWAVAKNGACLIINTPKIDHNVGQYDLGASWYKTTSGLTTYF